MLELLLADFLHHHVVFLVLPSTGSGHSSSRLLLRGGSSVHSFGVAVSLTVPGGSVRGLVSLLLSVGVSLALSLTSSLLHEDVSSFELESFHDLVIV